MASCFVNDLAKGARGRRARCFLGSTERQACHIDQNAKLYVLPNLRERPIGKVQAEGCERLFRDVQRRHLSAGGDLSGLSRRENARRPHSWIATARQIVARESTLRTCEQRQQDGDRHGDYAVYQSSAHF